MVEGIRKPLIERGHRHDWTEFEAELFNLVTREAVCCAPGQIADRRAYARYGGGPLISEKDLQNWFSYHSPAEEQITKYLEIRVGGHLVARTILKHTPPSPDQTAAIRKVREAVMTANAAIACHDPAV